MDYQAEKITPYGSGESKTEQVREMFDSIAPAYDFMNRAMTFGIDRIWRRKAIAMLRNCPANDLLDIATGTGDLALLADRMLHPRQITGIDLSENMLASARRKAEAAGAGGRIRFAKGDCLALDFPDNSFDIATVAYGVRNFEHIEKGYAELHRVLRPGGMLCVIELSTPTNPIARFFYKLYTRTLVPLAGRLVSKDTRAYSYLPESIAAVPQGNAMLDIMRRAGFEDCRCRRFSFGACSVYIAEKRRQ